MSTHKRLSFDVTINDAGERITLHIADAGNIKADNLTLSTWGSAEILANVLHRLEAPDLSGCGTSSNTHHVLELGAGTGLVGMSAAAIWKTNACLTDLDPILPNIQANINLNKTLLAKHDGSACCGLLDWARPQASIIPYTPQDKDDCSPMRARVILAADTVYSEEHPELLTGVLVSRLEKSDKARFIMCYPLRIGYLDHIRDLWERLEGAGLVSLQEGREELAAEWDEDVPYEWSVWGWGGEALSSRAG